MPTTITTADARTTGHRPGRRLASVIGLLLVATVLVGAPGAWSPAGAAEPVAGFVPTWAVATGPQSSSSSEGFALDFLGTSYSPTTEPGVLVRRVSPSGVLAGSLPYSGAGTIRTQAMAVDRNLDLFVAGEVTGTVVVGTGDGAATLDGGSGTNYVISWNPGGFVNWVQQFGLGGSGHRIGSIHLGEESLVLTATFVGSVTIDGTTVTSTGAWSALVGSFDSTFGDVDWLTTVDASGTDPALAWINDADVDDDSVAIVGRVQEDGEVHGNGSSAPIVCPSTDIPAALTHCAFYADLDLATGEPAVARPFSELGLDARGVAQDGDGIVVSGNVALDITGTDQVGFVAALDATGAAIWSQELDGLLGSADVEIDSRGDVVFAENRYETTVTIGSGPDAPVLPGSAGDDDVVLAEFDSTGTLLRYTQIVGSAWSSSNRTARLVDHGMAIGTNDEIVVAGRGDAPILFGSGPDQGVVDGPGPVAFVANFPPDVPATGSVFQPVAPTRLLDSRTATGGWNGKLVAGSPRPLTVAGANGVPADATAVVLNLTVTDVTEMTYLAAWPKGVAQPVASTLNAEAGDTIANLATLQVGVDGSILLGTAMGSVDVVADLLGYYVPGDAGDLFHPVSPARVLDSRTATGGWNGPLVSGAPRDLTVAGAVGVPADAAAVTMSVTVTNTSDDTFLRVQPAGTTADNSNVNVGAGQTITNLVTVQIGTGGALTFTNNTGSIEVVADVVGYYDDDAATGSRFVAVAPTRLLDTRNGTGGYTTPFDAGTVRTVATAPPASVVTGIAANLTVTNTTALSLLTLYPEAPRPDTSTILFTPDQTIAVGAVTGVAPDGTVSIFNQLGSANVVLDANGYFVGPEVSDDWSTTVVD